MKNRLLLKRLGGENGSALVVGIVFLLILTFLGVMGMQGSILQERMAGNTRDREMAFRAAEAALREAEAFLQLPVLPAFNDASSGLYQMDGTLPATLGWNNSDSVEYGGTLEGVASNPRYIVEELPTIVWADDLLTPDEPLPDDRYFRVTARSSGGTQSAVAILQSTYRR
jgi:type IV pilus assembly protein PilX